MQRRTPSDQAVEALRIPRSVRGALLRNFAASSGTRRISVIVQPHLTLSSLAEPVLDLAAAKRATAALKKDLARLGLLDRARGFSVFSGFVLEVTPRQLRLLGAAPAVQSIRPNLSRNKLIKANAQG